MHGPEIDTGRKGSFPAVSDPGCIIEIEVAKLDRPPRTLRAIVAGGVQSQEVNDNQVTGSR
jgi:hypothetical protein